jgi:periplasmic protein TonB
MVSQPFSIPALIDPNRYRGKKIAPETLRHAGDKDLFVDALLELPTAHQRRRNPLDWAVSLIVHVTLIAALLAVPLYFNETLDLKAFSLTMLVAVPPPPPPPPPSAMARQIVRPKMADLVAHGLVSPTFIPRQIAMIKEEVPPPNPDEGVMGGVPGGVPGGIPGGVIGGVLGGVLGSVSSGMTGPPPPKAVKKIVRVGGNVKPPRLISSPAPEYPQLAKAAKISGTVVIDAVIDEKGNVVEAHVISGPGLLIPAAMKAITSWRYEPTYLDGEPIEVRMHVDVNFLLQ